MFNSKEFSNEFKKTSCKWIERDRTGLVATNASITHLDNNAHLLSEQRTLIRFCFHNCTGICIHTFSVSYPRQATLKSTKDEL